MTTIPIERVLDSRLNIALKGGYYKTAEDLIVNPQINVNAKGIGGLTPLMLAAVNGYENLVGMLIDRGVETNSRDDEGRSALDHVKIYGWPRSAVHDRIVEMLLRNGAGERDVGDILLRLDKTKPLLVFENCRDIVIVKEIKGTNGKGSSRSYLNVSNAIEIRGIDESTDK